MRKRQGGFTLIELLVVIAIIGILATIVMVSLNTVRAKARDTQRVATVRQIQLALQMYYDANGSYPENFDTDWSALVPTYMGVKPADPGSAGGNYQYCISSTKGYHLGTAVVLEATTEGSGVLAGDADLTAATDGCTTGRFDGDAGIYDVTQ